MVLGRDFRAPHVEPGMQNGREFGMVQLARTTPNLCTVTSLNVLLVLVITEACNTRKVCIQHTDEWQGVCY